jgi:peptidyl-prolyl cis-trans isomerase SurA
MVLRSLIDVNGKSRLLALALLGLGFLATLPVVGVRAQTVVASVNGDPITTYDIAEREKLLRALSQPSSPQAAMNSLIESRVKAVEINKYNIKLSASELGPTYNYYAEKGHMTVQALSQRLGADHVDPKHAENFFSIHQAFELYVRARNRGVEVSTTAINAEVGRDRKLASEQTFVLRQVVLIVPPSSGEAGLQAAVKKMESMRARFTDCESGAKLARESGDFVIRESMTRTSSQLGDQLTDLLNKTPVGHLTASSRDSTGIAAIAVCEKKAAGADAAKDLAQQKLLQQIVDRQAQALYEELRSRAVIVKKGQ